MRKRRWDAKSKKLLLALKDNDGEGGGKENRLGRFFSTRRRQEEKYALTRTLMYVCSGYDAQSHTQYTSEQRGETESVFGREREKNCAGGAKNHPLWSNEAASQASQK